MTTKTAARVTAGIALPSGAITEILAVALGDASAAVAGLTIVIVGIASVVICINEAAVRDTSTERRQLQAAKDAAQQEYARWVAMRAELDLETERVLRAAELSERGRRAEYERLREELFADLEDRGATLRKEGYLLAIKHQDRGLLTPPSRDAVDAQVIPLPRTVGSSPTASGQGVHIPS